MKIYNMIEGKWLKDQKEEKKEKELREYEDFGIRTRLVAYDEEKEWIREEKNYTESKKKLDKDRDLCYDRDR
jgi:bifunctional pyridoxal-dependent enzyme with beta-cystathionase and maltose regulon repressor activities